MLLSDNISRFESRNVLLSRDNQQHATLIEKYDTIQMLKTSIKIRIIGQKIDIGDRDRVKLIKYSFKFTFFLLL